MNKIQKIPSIMFPISAFVAAGFEHSVANMYFISMGLFVKLGAPQAFRRVVGKTAGDYSSLTCYNFFYKNLMPVTMGNIIGGARMVYLVYWFVYLKRACAEAKCK
jgi:formate transporter